MNSVFQFINKQDREQKFIPYTLSFVSSNMKKNYQKNENKLNFSFQMENNKPLRGTSRIISCRKEDNLKTLSMKNFFISGFT